MTALQQEVDEAFRSINIAEDEAPKAATTLAKRDDDVQSAKSELALVKWMVGFTLPLTPLGFGSTSLLLWKLVKSSLRPPQIPLTEFTVSLADRA